MHLSTTSKPHLNHLSTMHLSQLNHISTTSSVNSTLNNAHLNHLSITFQSSNKYASQLPLTSQPPLDPFSTSQLPITIQPTLKTSLSFLNRPEPLLNYTSKLPLHLFSTFYLYSLYIIFWIACNSSCCVSVILYGLEAFSLNTSNLQALDTPLYNAMTKIFKSFDHNTLNWCMFYTDVLPLRLSHFKNKINYLSKMIETENKVNISLFE